MKKKITKKIGRKHLKEKKRIKAKVDNENLDKDNIVKTDSLDISYSEGDDTLNTIENKKKKKSTVEWIKAKRSPTKREERKMFGKALETMLITCMNHHLYQFENTIRIQKEGGPIGLKLTGEIADCLMLDWNFILFDMLSFY